jgi:hypothetical protein
MKDVQPAFDQLRTQSVSGVSLAQASYQMVSKETQFGVFLYRYNFEEA